MAYNGNRGVSGHIAYAITGSLYRTLGIPFKLFGKIMFFVLVRAIPFVAKSMLKLIINALGIL